MHTLLRSTFVTFAFVAMVLVPGMHAHAATQEEMLTRIQALMTQIQELQKQLATVRGEVKALLAEGLQEGTSNDDVRKVQQLLATDPTLYPEGMVTGYFGPKTKQAIMRFEMRHGLPATGEVSSSTRELLEQYLEEGFGGTIPPGLLQAPGIMKKVELRYIEGCENRGHGKGPLCKKLKLKYELEDDDSDDDSNDDSDDSHDDGFDVEVEVEHGKATVSFVVGSTTHEVTVTGTSTADILAAVAQKLGVAVDALDPDLVREIKAELARKTKTSNSSLAQSAQDAIANAETAIQDAEEAIAGATTSTKEAKKLLRKANDELEDAQEALDDRDYRDAVRNANKALGFAERAQNLVPSSDDSDDDDSDEDDDSDDEEDEDEDESDND